MSLVLVLPVPPLVVIDCSSLPGDPSSSRVGRRTCWASSAA